MVRTVVYEGIKGVKTEASGQPTQQAPDDFGDKLVKYIPAEVIAFFLPAYALVSKLGDPKLGDPNNKYEWVGWLILIISALASLGYLLIRADKEKPPRWYFYVLSVLAFIAWAIGTSGAGAELFKLHKPEITGKLIVMGAVFLIPLIDELLTRYLPPKATS